MKKISSTDSIPEVVGVSLKKKELLPGDRLLLLDNIQDPGNLGTIIRSSKAFNIDTIVVSPTTVDMYNPKVLRATEGMIFHINIIVRNLPNFITELKKDNYKILYKCEKCGYLTKNKAAIDDNINEIINLSVIK